MEHKTVAEGVKQFAQNAGGQFSRPDELLFQVTFPGEQYPTLIGIEVLGMTIS